MDEKLCPDRKLVGVRRPTTPFTFASFVHSWMKSAYRFGCPCMASANLARCTSASLRESFRYGGLQTTTSYWCSTRCDFVSESPTLMSNRGAQLTEQISA